MKNGLGDHEKIYRLVVDIPIPKAEIHDIEEVSIEVISENK